MNDILFSGGVWDLVEQVTGKWKLQLLIAEIMQFSIFHLDSALGVWVGQFLRQNVLIFHEISHEMWNSHFLNSHEIWNFPVK